MKCLNVLLDGMIRPLICDFGLTKMLEDETTVEFEGAGSTRWMAPELLDDAPKTTASDMYAFGMTIFEILTGNAPYAGRHKAACIAAILLGKPPECQPPSREGQNFEPLWEIASSCWDQNPNARPSAEVVVRDLGVPR